MRKLFGIFAIMVVLLLVGVLVFYVFVGKTALDEYNKYEENTEELKELVGEEVILKGDTLLVIDYSSFNNTITLEDKREISGDLAKTLDKVEKE